MALIIDPDNLSQGTLTSPGDAAWTASAGATTTITGAATLPSVSAGDFFEVRDHSTAGNNGLYVETGGTPTTSSITADKVDGVNPVNASAEAIRTFHTDATLADEKSVMIDVDQKRFYLLEQGNLSVDGVTGQALYSFAKEEWKTDADLIRDKFPIVSITPEQFEFIEGWELRTVTSPAIQSKKLFRTAGWSEVDVNDVLQKQFSGVITLGNFEDNTNDTAYYQLGDDPTDTGAAVDFTFNGPVNEAVKVFEQFPNPGATTAFATSTTFTRTTGSFITDGYVVGGQVTFSNAEDPANNVTVTLTAVAATTLTASGASFTTNADDTTVTPAVDNRNAIAVFYRVRDGDPNGKTYDRSDNIAIGKTTVDNKAERYPLSGVTDLQISETDANIDANSPYTEVRLRYLPAAYNRAVDSATLRNFGIVVDVGTHSKENGVSNGTTLVTAANFVLGAGEALADYTGGDLILHDATAPDRATHTISGTPVDNAGTLEITLTSALTNTESNLSFTMERATPLTATKNEIYEKVQRQLRLAGDIDESGPAAVINGRTADEIMDFIASNDVRFGFTDTALPGNNNGGGTGVICEGFDANDTNNYSFFDNGGVQRTFPFVSAGNISFNANLTGDTDPEFWMFFEYTTRTTVSDFAISAASGDTASFDSAGANLPTVAQNDYVRLTDMTNPTNNGVWVVTDAAPTASQFDARKIDGAAVVNESAASHPVDQNPIDSPQAIIVDDNLGADIVGSAASSPVAFTFDYDNNVQGGRTAATDAAIVIRAIGLETGQFAEVTGTITRATGLAFSVVSALERNYSNP